MLTTERLRVLIASFFLLLTTEKLENEQVITQDYNFESILNCKNFQNELTN